jgi:hypothetical protein
MHRIYVAGPYSVDPISCTEAAEDIAIEINRLGHFAHCPHKATFGWEDHIDYMHIIRLDLTMIEMWATALYFIAPSPGSLIERDKALELGLPIFTSVTQIPDMRSIE